MMNLKKFCNHTILILYIAIGLFFLLLWVNVEKLYLHDGDIKKVVCRILAVLLMSGGYILFYNKMGEYEETLKNYKHIILWSSLVVFSLFQLYLGNKLRITPLYDFESIYVGALDWIVTGDFSRYQEYFYYYPNNLGALYYLRNIFLISSKVGINDFYFIGMLMNSLSCVGAMAFVFYILEIKIGTKAGFMSLILFLLTPPMWFTASVFYTDSLTMIFPIGIYYFYLKLDQCKPKLHKLILGGLMILFTIVGYYLKPTVLIIFIAIVVELLIKLDFKKLIILAVVFLSLFSLSKLTFHYIFYPQYLDENLANKMKTPYETWIYMGLNDTYGFPYEDTLYGRSFENPDERKEKIREAIDKRIVQRGTLGTIKHEFNKVVTSYSDGTFELSYTFLFGFEKEDEIADFLVVNRDKYKYYWYLCANLYYEILLFLVVCVGGNIIKYLQRHDQDILKKDFVPILALFGLMLFLMIWENHYRYTINYYPIMVTLATIGIGNMKRKA